LLEKNSPKISRAPKESALVFRPFKKCRAKYNNLLRQSVTKALNLFLYIGTVR